MNEPQPFEGGLARALFEKRDFLDRHASTNGRNEIDVIIPLLHSTDLWRENLLSYFREIPIRKLFIGDAGCIDGSIAVLSEFPRVEILNHKQIATLGKSLAELIAYVETEKFIYLQSDVFLPNNWFDSMRTGSENLDWAGCPMQSVVLTDYRLRYAGKRPLAGSQIGRKTAFEGLSEFLDDDFVYRNEEYVLDQYVRNRGFTSGAVDSTFHFHEIMRRKSNGYELDVQGIDIHVDVPEAEKFRVASTQIFGIIKYCKPIDSEVIYAFKLALFQLGESGELDRKKLSAFAQLTNSDWLRFVNRYSRLFKLQSRLSKLSGLLFRALIH